VRGIDAQAMTRQLPEHVRRALAFVAWRLITGQEGAAVYDHSSDLRVVFSGVISGTAIDVRDDSGRRFVGSGGSGMYTLEPGPGAKPVTLRISGLDFDGFDYGSSCRYRGSVDRDRLSLRHGSVAKAYDFSIAAA